MKLEKYIIQALNINNDFIIKYTDENGYFTLIDSKSNNLDESYGKNFL